MENIEKSSDGQPLPADNSDVSKFSQSANVVEKSLISPLLQSVNFQQITILLLVAAVIVLIIGAAMVWVKKPDQIIVKQDANGVVELIVNERSFGDIIKPNIQSKGESDEVKIYLSKQFAELAYAVNPESRVDQLKKLLNWFPDDQAKTRTLFSNAIQQIKNDPNACMPTALEVSQGWFSTVTIQEAKIDSTNKNIVNVLLVQNLQKRLVSNQVENRQLSLQVEFAYLGVPTEENFMTGYSPKFVSCRVLPSAIAPATTTTTTGNNNPQAAPTTAVAAPPLPAATVTAPPASTR